MPYKSPNEVKEKVRGADKLSERKLKQFMHVFNSCWEKHSDDSICHAMAWGVVNKTASLREELDDVFVEIAATEPRMACRIASDVRCLRNMLR